MRPRPPSFSPPSSSLPPPSPVWRRALPGKAHAIPVAAGLPLPARLGDPAGHSAGGGAARVLSPLWRGGPWVTQPKTKTAWKTASSSAPGRRPPPRATQGRAQSGLWRARRACSGLDRTWPARRPLEVLSRCGCRALRRPPCCRGCTGQRWVRRAQIWRHPVG
jgi:hypothetical protein